MKIKELIEATNAKVIKPLEENLDVKISTDTRTIKDGDFYLPLKGASFDGEKFIDKALKTIDQFNDKGIISSETKIGKVFTYKGFNPNFKFRDYYGY